MIVQTPQTPIVRTATYEKYRIDDSPLGTNAIVAVLAYSGYVFYKKTFNSFLFIF